MTPKVPLIVVVNHSPETLVLFRNVLEEAGMNAVLCHAHEIEAFGLLDFIENHRPDLVIYDIPHPYDENIASFREYRSDPRAEATLWLMCTTGQSVVESLQDSDDDVVGKPFDLDEIMDRITDVLGRELAQPG